MLISYFAILISLKVAHKKADKWIPKNSHKYTVTLQLLRKVMEEYILWLEQFSFVYFLSWFDNGTEGAFLVINGIVSLFFFMFTLGSYPNCLSL